MLKILIFSSVLLLCVNASSDLDQLITEVIENCKCMPKNLCEDALVGDEKNAKCENENEVCCLNKSQKQKRQVENRPVGCGYRNTQGIGSPRPGAQEGETNFGEITWMAQIYRVQVDPATSIERNVFICGGSLINPKAVLTAAHCVHGANAGKRLRVRVGEWDTQSTNEMYPYQDRDVIEVNTPKNYRAGTLYNDLSILILNEPIESSPHIGLICLPKHEAPIPTSGDCFVSGWGKNKAGIEATILKNVQQPIVDDNTCIDILRTTKLGQEFELHFNFFCAGGVVGQDVCGGFGGSPLVCPVPGQSGRYYQAGLVSWGIGCGDHVPGVYTNVANFRNWIDEQMQYKRLNESLYKY